MRGKIAVTLALVTGLPILVQGCRDASRDRASRCARVALVAHESPEDFRVLRRSIGTEGNGDVTVLDIYYTNGDGRPVIARDNCAFENGDSERRLAEFYHQRNGE